MLGRKVLLGNELLHLVDGNRRIDAPARAGVLTTAVADAAANRRQRILTLDEGQRVAITPLRRELEVSLHRDVSRARGLARGRSRVIGLDAVLVPIIGAPLLRTPLHGVGQLLLGILRHLPRARGAQLLAELYRPRGAHLDASAAGHALVGLGARHICGAGQVRRVEQLRGAQRIAHVHVAVADGEDLVLAIDVGDLMHKAVGLGLAKRLVDLLARDVVAAIGLHHVVGHVAHRDAPVVRVVTAALAQLRAAHAAAARARCVLALVLVEPMLDVLDRDGAVLHLDRLLDRDDVHADSRASGRHHRRGLGKGSLGGLLEKLRHSRMLVDLGLAHVEELGRTGHEHGQHPLLRAGGVLPVVLEQTDVAHLIEQLLERLGLHPVALTASASV